MKKLLIPAIPTVIFLCIILRVKDYLDEYYLNISEEEQLKKLIVVLFVIAILFTVQVVIQLRRFLKFHKRKKDVLRMVERGDVRIMFLNETNRNWPVQEILTEYNPDADVDYAKFLLNLYSKRRDRKITKIPSWSLVVKHFPKEVIELNLN